MLSHWIKKRLLRLIIVLVALLSVGTATYSQGVIKGKILDATTGETMIGANVVIKGTTIGTTTGLDGTFELKVKENPPIQLIISFIGYEKVEYTVNSFDDKVKVKLDLNNVMLDAVEVVDSRISDRQKQAALTVESLDVIAIKDAPSGNFYESLGNLKGVDLTSASLGFKVINTRGFNSTSPVRSLQLIDGVDNQSPGLNFSLGNFLGASDIDLMRVDIVAGASSAFYGPGAFNGVVNMTTKDPFMFPGLTVSAKAGERNMSEFAVRWAQVLHNKEGEEKFGYKLNAYYFSALDWEAENYDPVEDSEVPATNPGGFDAVNIYGDEGTSASNNDFTLSPIDKDSKPGLGQFFRTGYREVDLADYNTDNLKLNGAFHYKITDSIQAIYAVNYSTGTTVYQGDNRYSLNNIQFLQNRLELKKEGKWFVRAYATHEDAGDSYDLVTTGLRINEDAESDQTWNENYASRDGWLQYGRKLENLDGYPRPNFIGEEWEAEYDAFIAQPYVQDSLRKWHALTREAIDNDPPTGKPRYVPGTTRFDSIFNDVRSRKFTEGGSLFFDRSALYHVQGEYKFEPKWAEIRVGGNGRLYTPNSQGTIFSDTLEFDRIQTDSGLVKTDSSYKQITNMEFGVYVGLEKKVLSDRLKINATLRMDKNQNFDYLFSPAVSLVYSPNEKHTFRASFSSAVRNPTLADQYLFYNVGRAILLGNLNGIDSIATVESTVDYINASGNPDTLDIFNVDPIAPEQVRTVEAGYRGTLGKKVYVDASAYYSWYTNFIGFVIGVESEFQDFISDDYQVYRVAANAQSLVTTQGFNVGVNYYFHKKFKVTGNYSYNKLTSGDDDPIIPAFNTPENKYNLGISGSDFTLPFIKLKHVGFGVNYKWIEGFRFEGSPQFTGNIPSYDLVDAQVSVEVPQIFTTFKVGASNLLNNQVFQVYGGPRVGRLAYFSVLFDLSTR